MKWCYSMTAMVLTSDSKKSLRLELLEHVTEQTPIADLWCGFASFKSERLDYVIQKTVEIDVGVIYPVITAAPR
ncbi:MAG: hypothetical protein MO846_10035 [Candidatus Devosia symbiotica]|nr:hypothetical protein [Candidatus Devosia symbiotica]